jgi:hypothetical protein
LLDADPHFCFSIASIRNPFEKNANALAASGPRRRASRRIQLRPAVPVVGAGSIEARRRETRRPDPSLGTAAAGLAAKVAAQTLEILRFPAIPVKYGIT